MDREVECYYQNGVQCFAHPGLLNRYFDSQLTALKANLLLWYLCIALQ
jgi:hypothetical protein